MSAAYVEQSAYLTREHKIREVGKTEQRDCGEHEHCPTSFLALPRLFNVTKSWQLTYGNVNIVCD